MNRKQKTRIVFLDASTLDLGDIDWSHLKKLGDLMLYANTTEAELLQRAKNADVIITNKVLWKTSHAFELQKLRLICAAATGYNHIDVASAKSVGIAVANVPGYSTPSVVEHAVLFLLALSHRLLEHHQAVMSGKWSASPHFTILDYPFEEIAGRTLGIIGYGTIGKRVARVAKSLGMKILIAKIPGRKYADAIKRLSLNAVLKQSDYISLHCSLSEQTRRLINKDRLALFKKSACLLNLARGAIVDEEALAQALKQGALAGYATDVLEQEPPPADHPLFDVRLQGKVIFTPHVAWASRESRQQLVVEIAENIRAFMQGKRRNRVE